MKKTNIALVPVSLFLMVAMLLVGCSQSTATTTAPPGAVKAATTAVASIEEVVQIGDSIVLSGPYAAAGIPVQRAVNMAVEMVNAKGIRAGDKVYKFKVIYDDNANTAAPSVATVNKQLYTDKDRIIFTFSTPPSQAVAPIVDREQVLHFTVSNLQTLIGPTHPRTFRTYPSASEYVGPYVDWLAKNRPQIKSVYGFIKDDGSTGPVFDTFFKKAFDYYSIKVLGQQVYPTTTTEFSVIIDKAMATKPDAVWVGNSITGPLVKQLREKGYSGQIMFLGPTDSTLSVAGDAALEGGLATNMDASSPLVPQAMSQFLNNYKSAYGDAPNAFAIDQYTQIFVLASAISVAGSVDVDKLVNVLETQELDSPWGRIRFGGEEVYGINHQAYLPVFVSQYQSGQSKTISAISPADALAISKLLNKK